MKILCTVPTYNESENIRPLIDELLALGDEYEVLVIDDNSPDGTWKIVDEIANSNPRVHLLHRTKDKGRGTAGLEGFKWARDNGADAVVEMDADFSHHPRFIPSLVQPVRDGSADIVIGSRLVDGGTEVGRSPVRTAITLAANFYIQTVLGLKIRDCTSGFRVFSQRAMQEIPWEKMTARGPEIVQEVLNEGRRAKLRFAELPITFEERRAGQSTFNAKIMVRSLIYVAKLRLK